MALRLILHTFRMIFGNFGQALKISVGPYIIMMIGVFAILAMISPTIDTTVGVSPMVGLVGLLLLPLVFFVTAWVAVSWHRFILKEEYAGILPAISGRPIWPYVGKAILLGLLIFAISIPIFLILSFTVMPMMGVASLDGPIGQPPMPIFAMLVFAVAFVIIGFISLRLGVSLVGTAVGKPMKFGEAWAATKPLAGTIFGVTVLLVLINVLPSAVTTGIGLRVPLIGGLLSIVLNWLTTMLGISILTTIYGHVVEGRPLAD